MNDLDLLKRDLLLETDRCRELLDSQVFSSSNNSIFTQSAFIEVLVRLNFILQKLNQKNNRITWMDAIQIQGGVKDITDLVNFLRNAACHSESLKNYINNTNIKFVFNRTYALNANLVPIRA